MKLILLKNIKQLKIGDYVNIIVEEKDWIDETIIRQRILKVYINFEDKENKEYGLSIYNISDSRIFYNSIFYTRSEDEIYSDYIEMEN